MEPVSWLLAIGAVFSILTGAYQLNCDIVHIQAKHKKEQQEAAKQNPNKDNKESHSSMDVDDNYSFADFASGK